MNTVNLSIIFFFCATIALIGCGEVSGSENYNSSSSGQQEDENGVCYVPTHSGSDISSCYIVEGESFTVNEEYCKYFETQVKHPVEWRSKCPENYKLECVLKDNIKVRLYGKDATGVTCDIFKNIE